MEILPFGFFQRLTSRERPTGGLVDAPSSKAVEEAGHCERIVLREKAVGKRTKALKRGGTEETEKGEITNNAEIAKQSKLIECHCRQQLSFTPLLPPFLRVSSC
jgi:hypothetical protein